jgi:hypothetical protein
VVGSHNNPHDPLVFDCGASSLVCVGATLPRLLPPHASSPPPPAATPTGYHPLSQVKLELTELLLHCGTYGQRSTFTLRSHNTRQS